MPKGVPTEPGGRALAVHVEDHPLAYATFAGEIPQGQYGAGSVEIWDNGVYELLEEKENGQLTVRLEGKRLNGTAVARAGEARREAENWLLIKNRDDEAPEPRRTGRTARCSRRSTTAFRPATSGSSK